MSANEPIPLGTIGRCEAEDWVPTADGEDGRTVRCDRLGLRIRETCPTGWVRHRTVCRQHRGVNDIPPVVGKKTMKVIRVSNHDHEDYRSDQYVVWDGLGPEEAAKLADDMNRDPGRREDDWYRVVEDDYVLRRFEP